jgi:hypothetical protein
MIKQCGFILIMVFAVSLSMGCGDDEYDITAVTGATKVVLARRAPSDINLVIKGLVKREYRFNGDALNALASTRIRTREVSPEGRFLGAYTYTGVPVYNILNGIAPMKPADAACDRPLDMVVTFTNRSGGSVHFRRCWLFTGRRSSRQQILKSMIKTYSREILRGSDLCAPGSLIQSAASMMW